ncbi:hypothetical protein Cflav_PD3371 [Pedosphaera parvula Ellin514]|uniref:Uncharacterized protein n=1 Tax=Pedosphaera parvula (strain Ellin514) TaxID=320771 RepID=B9XIE0_PEDPL|nr:hypothetical protein Cflav_PD3371 [Pedosphaera parvula Ellin514]
MPKPPIAGVEGSGTGWGELHPSNSCRFVTADKGVSRWSPGRIIEASPKPSWHSSQPKLLQKLQQ